MITELKRVLEIKPSFVPEHWRRVSCRSLQENYRKLTVALAGLENSSVPLEVDVELKRVSTFLRDWTVETVNRETVPVLADAWYFAEQTRAWGALLRIEILMKGKL